MSKKAQLFTGLGAVVLLLTLLVVAVIIYFGTTGRLFYIPGESNEPTMLINDRIYTKKVSAGSSLERGTFVLFKTPKNSSPIDGPQYLVKRIVGLPGDVVESSLGQLFVNGQAVNEPYLNQAGVTEGVTRTTIPAGTVYVLGDNRLNSQDSRVWGPIPRDTLEYEAKRIIFPLDRSRSL